MAKETQASAVWSLWEKNFLLSCGRDQKRRTLPGQYVDVDVQPGTAVAILVREGASLGRKPEPWEAEQEEGGSRSLTASLNQTSEPNQPEARSTSGLFSYGS